MNISDRPTEEDCVRARKVKVRQRTILSLVAAVLIVSVGVLALR